MFIAFIGIARIISLGEGRLLEAVSGEGMPRPPVHPGARDGVGSRIIAMLQDVRTWTTIAYLLLMLPLGIAYLVAAFTGLSVGLAFMLVPVVGVAPRLGWWVPWERVRPIAVSPAWLDTPGGWVFSIVFGVVVLTTLLHLARGIIGVHARTAKALLVTPRA